MKLILKICLFLLVFPVHAITWEYQVTINGNPGSQKIINTKKNTFDAGAYFCEVTPVTVNNKTEYRSLICSVGSSTVSTGGHCTDKEAKFTSVQYAVLNITGPKNIVNVTVACKF